VSKSDVETVVIGGGAAGIAAAKRLRQAPIDCLLLEARSRLGGRAWTVTDGAGYALDLGCGWLHSADRNPWADVAKRQGAVIDKTPPPWTRPALALGFTPEEQGDFRQTMGLFFARVEEAAQRENDMAASALLDPGGRWNGLVNAMSTYIAGVELDRLSVKDFDRYEDSGVNWRVVEGFGTLISSYGADLETELDCEVRCIDHCGKRLRIETSKGPIAADRAIVTVPSNIIAAERMQFAPALPAKIEAARGLPLGLDDKLFMSLENAGEFASDVRLFGHTDRAATAGYHIRPFGRPMIEAYFGGKLASDLEAQGEAAFFDFAVTELTGVFGSEFAARVKPIRVHRWGRDPFALGSYSCALPGFADCRSVLAAPVDDRLFFAGEACSRHDFSTAHGGFNTGFAAAEQIIAAHAR